MILLTDYVDRVGVFVTRNADQEVVWLDIAVDQRFIVNRLNATNLFDEKAVSNCKLRLRRKRLRWALEQ